MTLNKVEGICTIEYAPSWTRKVPTNSKYLYARKGIGKVFGAVSGRYSIRFSLASSSPSLSSSSLKVGWRIGSFKSFKPESKTTSETGASLWTGDEVRIHGAPE